MATYLGKRSSCIALVGDDSPSKYRATGAHEQVRLTADPFQNAQKFEQNENVEIFSGGQRRWMPGVVEATFPKNAVHDGYHVEAGTLRVRYFHGGFKYVLAEDVGKIVRKASPDKKEKLEAATRHEDPKLLQRMTFQQLKQIARAMGFDDEALNDAEGKDDFRAAVIQMISGKELQSMRLKQLKDIARAMGFDQKSLDDADGTNDAAAAVIQLISKTISEKASADVTEDEIYSKFSKLYCFVGNDWEDRGTGEAKLLKHKKTGQVRFILQQEKTMKTLCNHLVVDVPPYCNLLPNAHGDRCWVWTAQDFANDGMKVEKLALQFGTSEQADDFKKAFDNAKQLNKKAASTVSDNVDQLSEKATGKAMQVDGHAEVALRDVPNQGRVVAMVPNGEHLQILQTEGASMKVRWKEVEGWAKACNVQPALAVPMSRGGA